MHNFSRILITVLLVLSAAAAHAATFRVIYINDFHGFANPTTVPGSKQQLGGAAALAARLKILRAEKPGIFVAAGDIIQGDSWANLSQGASAIKLMNHLQLDAMVTGNHEFDFGQEQLKQRIKEASFPVLAANLSGISSTSPRVYFNRPGGRIAVIGLVTPDVPQTSHPKNTKGLKFSPVLETAREQISEAEITASLIVLLTHIGHENDLALAEAMCKNQTESEAPVLIVGGHSHTKVEKPVQIGNCVVVQAWEHGKALGVVDLTIEKGKLLSVDGWLEHINPAGSTDPETAALVDRYNQRINKLLGKKAGTAKVDLIQEGVRRQETNLGNLVADIVRKTTGAQVAVINGGSIRTGIPKGEITRRQVYATLPFNNYLVAVRMTGKQLLETIEHGVSDIEHEEGRFPQVSGIRFSFNRHKPAGQRVTSLSVGDTPLDLQKEYTVATLDFIAAGGDGYTAFGQAIRSAGDFSELNGAMQSSRLVYNNPGYFLRDAVLEVFSSGAPVSATVEGRITETR
jgi:5'-nucleotidase / UDP-sugar diphosphatase